MRGMLCGHISCRSITFPLIHSYSTSLLISELFQSCKSYKSRKSVSPHKTPHKTATCHYCPPVNKTNKKTYKMLLSSDIRRWQVDFFFYLWHVTHRRVTSLLCLVRKLCDPWMWIIGFGFRLKRKRKDFSLPLSRCRCTSCDPNSCSVETNYKETLKWNLIITCGEDADDKVRSILNGKPLNNHFMWQDTKWFWVHWYRQ